MLQSATLVGDHAGSEPADGTEDDDDEQFDPADDSCERRDVVELRTHDTGDDEAHDEAHHDAGDPDAVLQLVVEV